MSADTINNSNAVGRAWQPFWPSAVGSDIDLTAAQSWPSSDGAAPEAATSFGRLPARRIVVGVIPASGTLVLTQMGGPSVMFTAAQIYALGQVLDGQWTGVTAAGSTCYNLAICW